MPRTLPWLTEPAKKKHENQGSSSPLPTPKPKRKRDSSSDDLVDSDLNTLNPVPEPKTKKKSARSPSPSPLPAPPDVEYMREGYNADDIYMMVEDEFLSTAKLFTQHIHHAEYVRLKKLAKSRGTGVLRSMSRPVDGRTEQSAALKVKLEAGAKAKKIKDSMGEGDSENESSEDEYMQDPQLAGLMTREKGSKDLSGIAKARSNTRAAAGFVQSPHNVERKRDALKQEDTHKPEKNSKQSSKSFEEEAYSSDENGLDAAPARPMKALSDRSEQWNSTILGLYGAKGKSSNSKSPENPSIFKQFAQKSKIDDEASLRDEDFLNSKQKQSTSFPANQSESTTTSVTNPSPKKSTHSAGVSSYLAKRRADREKKDLEEKRKAKRTDEVPTFLL